MEGPLTRVQGLLTYVEWLSATDRMRRLFTEPNERAKAALDMAVALDDWMEIPESTWRQEP